MESALRKAGVYRNGTIFQKIIRLLAYTDDYDITGRTKRDVTAAFIAIKRKSSKMDLAVNEGKTRYMLATNWDQWIYLPWLRRCHQKCCLSGATMFSISNCVAETAKIFGPVQVGNDFRIWSSSKLYELLNDIDFVQRITIQRLRWHGNVVRMAEDDPPRRVFNAAICRSG